ncbi:MAG TPA: S41 family peptidase [Candidatus Absconditabacterales bacterium]|nr:S41 family peptidase [Candidatus Absconditabacterales bacterium]
MKKFKIVLIFLLGILIGGSIMRFGPNDFFDKIFVGTEEQSELDYYKNKYNRFEALDEVLRLGYYDYEKINQDDMIKGAIKAYIDSIKDPYTVYMDAEQNSGFLGSLEGEENFEGIGAAVTKKEYYIQIEEVLKESPAMKAGLKPLDRIVAINTGYVEDETLEESVARIKGPAGTDVSLIIERYEKDDKREVFEVTITRENINLPSVESSVFEINGKKIGYIEMFLIGEETENIFKKEVNNLKSEGIEGIILDLRGNGGGLMPVAVEIVSHFVPKGQLVVSAKYKGYTDEKYYSRGFGEFEGIKTVVLIDGMTASAGEIIAAALQEQAGAKLLGTNTFGKGTIQTLDEFSDGDSLKYTIGKRFPASDKNIDNIGIKPDITVEFDMESYLENSVDNQLEEAKSLF